MNRPVFIVGAPRSGTTLLYHILLSSGDFAVYRAETRAYDLIGPRFDWLRTREAREEFLDRWTRGYMFRRSGLNEARLRPRILDECEGTGDFLRVFMEAIAEDQGVSRWAECTPTHALHMERIARDFPDALFVHVIRDGRDVALSMARQGWIRPLPWDRGKEAIVSAIYWEWIVRSARSAGELLDGRYHEVRFEEIVERPESSFAELGTFLGHPLDPSQVYRNGVGSVKRPNTSFEDEPQFAPVGRWRDTPEVVQEALGSHVGAVLEDLGYDVGSLARLSTRATFRNTMYRWLFQLKETMRSSTPLACYLVRDDELLRSEPSS